MKSMLLLIPFVWNVRIKFFFSHHLQVEVVNTLQLLTAKPVTYLVNLSEKDYIRKKNKWWVVLWRQ